MGKNKPESEDIKVKNLSKNSDSMSKEEPYVVKQSMQLTRLKYDFTKIEKNIFLKIIELCQKYEKGEILDKGCDFELKVGEYTGKEAPVITFPIKDMIMSNHHGYEIFRDGLESLSEKPFYIPDKNWDFNRIYLFQSIKGSNSNGLFKIYMTDTFWDAYHDLHAFKLIDTSVAYNFRSVFTSRMYELLVGNTANISYKLANLMKMFSKEETYTPSEFITFVIKVAQKEMREMEYCPFYFEYKVTKAGRKLDNITFEVIHKKKLGISDKNESAGVIVENCDSDVLNEKISASVKVLFDISDLNASIEGKLLRAQQAIGVVLLSKKIGEIYTKVCDLTTRGELKQTPVAYLSGSLDIIYNDAMKKQAALADIKSVAETVVPNRVVSQTEPAASDYEIMTAVKFTKKALLAGVTLEEYIEITGAEKLENGKYRVKL